MSYFETTKKIRFWDHKAHVVVVPDEAAGRRRRYTVYRIPAAPSRPVRIIGREVTIGVARRLARKALGT